MQRVSGIDRAAKKLAEMRLALSISSQPTLHASAADGAADAADGAEEMVHPSFASSDGSLITIRMVREAKARFIDQLTRSYRYQSALCSIRHDRLGHYRISLADRSAVTSTVEARRKQTGPTVYDLLRYETDWSELRDAFVRDMSETPSIYCSISVDREPGKASLCVNWNSPSSAGR